MTKNRDVPDPFTAEGQAEIKRRVERAKKLCEGSAERAIKYADSDPVGRLTDPSELDLRRNYKHDD